MLKGKEIVLGVTGGIAVYKAVELLRLLVKAGATVHVVMTKGAKQFVTPLTFQTLSGNPVHSELFNLISEQEIGHISLAERADLFIVAPATANCIGKLACGIADDLLTTTVMATRAPVLIAPAMNVNMYHNPIYRENEERLKKHGYLFVAPACGMLACGYEGEGKLQAPEVILEEAVAALTPKRLKGERVLVTAGPTLEEIDPVRFISNHSSGKMGYAIARQARLRGAEVTLVTGPAALSAPHGVKLVRVQSATEMRDAVLDALERTDIVIKAAAVADYRPRSRSGQKMKKSEAELCIELEKNPDILAEIGAMKGGRLLVGFAAETQELVKNAGAKLKAKNLDLVVANDVSQEGAGFNVDTNIVKLLYRDGRVEELPMMGKDELAGEILERVEVLRGATAGKGDASSSR
ncbi:Phosphopantothenoylcysteine decarboxylase/Phosphopantothenoylcysteine synthetase [Citrifermentans bremense]|uniref:Coenzyme A biosynthesis bifunctional protein CoaBC n=1 Tax=Citrifermentans bremense TaxID=60035 RepID=A0A6S6M7A3_9BACT|nr:bifunctional phosphopantothenoylcysteine decarboxylase/phosphopantothenate--cysteine ligase CoaBC [Citrifermentans bremense]BCG47736.1 Phosphopantothenoylcysteine decarboxylase/Phosphopantothenoylcysteine synthetase [Citrifermentans bremense]